MHAEPPTPQAAPQAAEHALSSYLRAVRAHKLLVGAVVALALLAAFAFIGLRSRSYEATAQVLVTPLPQDD